VAPGHPEVGGASPAASSARSAAGRSRPQWLPRLLSHAASSGRRAREQGSSVERSGAAQGLAEVVAVLGPAHLDALLPNVLAACVSRNAYVREGHLTLFKFLPLAIPDAFQARRRRPAAPDRGVAAARSLLQTRCGPGGAQEHLGEVLPAILDGLADEAEGVRDAALAAGRTAVELYAQVGSVLTAARAALPCIVLTRH